MNKGLPRNNKEGLIYGFIICALSCVFMATINIAIGMGGFSKESMIVTLKCIPFLFIIALLLENFIVGKIAEKAVEKFSSHTDSFNAQILFRILFTVIGMSLIMTIIGGLFGSGFVEVIKHFPIAWPRNFCMILFWEILVAQPIARKVMRMMHKDDSEEDSEDNNDSIKAVVSN